MDLRPAPDGDALLARIAQLAIWIVGALAALVGVAFFLGSRGLLG